MLSLREHHLQKCKKEGKPLVEMGDVVLKSDLSNRAFWKLGVVEKLLYLGTMRGLELISLEDYTS